MDFEKDPIEVKEKKCKILFQYICAILFFVLVISTVLNCRLIQSGDKLQKRITNLEQTLKEYSK